VAPRRDGIVGIASLTAAPDASIPRGAAAKARSPNAGVTFAKYIILSLLVSIASTNVFNFRLLQHFVDAWHAHSLDGAIV
jgi:hypothetical protein